MTVHDVTGAAGTRGPLRYATVGTPTGPWTAVVDDADVVVAAGFCEPPLLLARLTLGAEDPQPRHVADLGPVSAAMGAYLAGDLAALDRLEVRQPGGDFQQQVWHRMREIPPGQSWSYGQLASKSGRSAAVRAVGTACARNLVAPVVPCHRVVRSDGSLGGYYYGLSTKRWLLAHEGVTPAA
jgi:methylated-DNA-[protein]-cysteine S-methyltransferase